MNPFEAGFARMREERERVQKMNAAFERASPSKRIVMIAEDVIRQLDAKKIVAVHGQYVEIEIKDDAPVQQGPLSNSNALDFLLSGQIEQCSVCAIGAACISAIRVRDKVKQRDIGSGLSWDSSEFMPWLTESMPRPLLRKMEQAFEDEQFGYGKFDYGESRLRAIYKNLINNGGRRFTHARTGERVWPRADDGDEDWNF